MTRSSYPAINRNMRCIEIFVGHRKEAEQKKINRNMRCIEIMA